MNGPGSIQWCTLPTSPRFTRWSNARLAERTREALLSIGPLISYWLFQTRCLICYPLHRRLGVGVTLGFHIELALKGGKLAAGTLDRLVLPCSTLRSVSSARSTADCNAAQQGVVI